MKCKNCGHTVVEFESIFKNPDGSELRVTKIFHHGFVGDLLIEGPRCVECECENAEILAEVEKNG